MNEFKVGDIVVAREEDAGITQGGHYRVIGLDCECILFIDDGGNERVRDAVWYTPVKQPNPQLHTHPTESVSLETHPTGAIRESKEGKGRPDLVLAGFPRALAALSRHVDCELGRERNWEKGLPETSLISSQFRHLLGYTSGVSDDTPLYNLTANLWNAIVLLETYMRVGDGEMDEGVLDIEKKYFSLEDE